MISFTLVTASGQPLVMLLAVGLGPSLIEARIRRLGALLRQLLLERVPHAKVLDEGLASDQGGIVAFQVTH